MNDLPQHWVWKLVGLLPPHVQMLIDAYVVESPVWQTIESSS